jgi:hypothetical protein
MDSGFDRYSIWVQTWLKTVKQVVVITVLAYGTKYASLIIYNFSVQLRWFE